MTKLVPKSAAQSAERGADISWTHRPVSATNTAAQSGSATISPSIYKMLRYVEWAFLVAVLLRLLLVIVNRPLAFEFDTSDYVSLGIVITIGVLSLFYPIDRPRWQRQVYILVEIVLLLISRAFSEWELDLLLYLVLVKSCFLLPRRDVIITTIFAGVAWQLSIARYLLYRFSAPVEMRETFEDILNLPKNALIWHVVLQSSVVYLALSLLVVLLSMTVLAERKSRQQAAELSQEVEILAADLERIRIARDIHDSLGHTLTTLDVQLEVAQTLRLRDPGRSTKALNLAKHLSKQSLQEIRRAVSTMRRGNFDLSAALTNLIVQIEQTHLHPYPCKIETQIDLPRLSLQVSQQLFLILKEGLTNVQKHSRATVVKLRARPTPEGLLVSLSDNGVGFSPERPNRGFGLRGMQERVRLLNGKMTVHSALGEGTLIQVTIPR